MPLEIRLFYPQLCSRGSRERRSQSNRWSLWQASDYEGNLAVFSVHQYLLQFNRRGVWLLYTHIEKANSLEPAWTHMWRIRVNFINENFDDDDFFAWQNTAKKTKSTSLKVKTLRKCALFCYFFIDETGRDSSVPGVLLDIQKNERHSPPIVLLVCPSTCKQYIPVIDWRAQIPRIPGDAVSTRQPVSEIIMASTQKGFGKKQ